MVDDDQRDPAVAPASGNVLDERGMPNAPAANTTMPPTAQNPGAPAVNPLAEEARLAELERRKKAQRDEEQRQREAAIAAAMGGGRPPMPPAPGAHPEDAVEDKAPREDKSWARVADMYAPKASSTGDEVYDALMSIFSGLKALVSMIQYKTDLKTQNTLLVIKDGVESLTKREGSTSELAGDYADQRESWEKFKKSRGYRLYKQRLSMDGSKDGIAGYARLLKIEKDIDANFNKAAALPLDQAEKKLDQFEKTLNTVKIAEENKTKADEALALARAEHRLGAKPQAEVDAMTMPDKEAYRKKLEGLTDAVTSAEAKATQATNVRDEARAAQGGAPDFYPALREADENIAAAKTSLERAQAALAAHTLTGPTLPSTNPADYTEGPYHTTLTALTSAVTDATLAETRASAERDQVITDKGGDPSFYAKKARAEFDPMRKDWKDFVEGEPLEKYMAQIPESDQEKFENRIRALDERVNNWDRDLTAKNAPSVDPEDRDLLDLDQRLGGMTTTGLPAVVDDDFHDLTAMTDEERQALEEQQRLEIAARGTPAATATDNTDADSVFSLNVAGAHDLLDLEAQPELQRSDTLRSVDDTASVFSLEVEGTAAQPQSSQNPTASQPVMPASTTSPVVTSLQEPLPGQASTLRRSESSDDLMNLELQGVDDFPVAPQVQSTSHALADGPSSSPVLPTGTASMPLQSAQREMAPDDSPAASEPMQKEERVTPPAPEIKAQFKPSAPDIRQNSVQGDEKAKKDMPALAPKEPLLTKKELFSTPLEAIALIYHYDRVAKIDAIPITNFSTEIQLSAKRDQSLRNANMIEARTQALRQDMEENKKNGGPVNEADVLYLKDCDAAVKASRNAAVGIEQLAVRKGIPLSATNIPRGDVPSVYETKPKKTQDDLDAYLSTRKGGGMRGNK